MKGQARAARPPIIAFIALLFLVSAFAASAESVPDLIGAAWRAQQAAGGQINDDPAVIAAIDRLWQVRDDESVPEKERLQATGVALHLHYRARGIESVMSRIRTLESAEAAWGPVFDLLTEAKAWDRLVQHAQALLKEDAEPSLEAHARYALGTAYRQRGDVEAGRRALTKLLISDSEGQWAALARGDLYEMEHLILGEPVPAFHATDLDGNPVSSDGLRGRVVLLDFWASY